MTAPFCAMVYPPVHHRARQKDLRGPYRRSKGQRSSRKPAIRLPHSLRLPIKVDAQTDRSVRTVLQCRQVKTKHSRNGANTALSQELRWGLQALACVYEVNGKVGATVHEISFCWVYAACAFVTSTGMCVQVAVSVCMRQTEGHVAGICVCAKPCTAKM